MRVVLAFLLIANLLLAGKHDHPSLESLQNQYPSEKAIFLNRSEHLVIKCGMGHLTVYEDVLEEVLYLKKEAKVFADESIYFSRFSEIEKLKAWTYTPKGKPGKYKKVKVAEIEEKNSISGGVFYDDSKKLTFNFPSTGEGTKTYLSYRKVYKDPKFLGKFYFQYYIPSLNSEYKITVDNNCEVGFKLFNDPEGKIEFIKEVSGNTTTYIWRLKNSVGYNRIGGEPSLSYYSPHIAVYLKSYEDRKGKHMVLDGPSELFDWYKTLVNDINTEEDPALKKITDSIVNGISETDEKAKRIFHWVQDHIKYVAFEDGMAGFIPSQAALVCSKRYGDCKGMSSIITEMLEYAGVEGYLVWVGSRDIPYRYDELATPVVDNHMIGAYKRDNGEIVFLDAVGSYTPFGYPTSFIQGKQAMIRINADSFMLKEVPIMKPEENLHVDTVQMTLEDNKLIGTGTVDAIGYNKISLTRRLLSKNHRDRTESLQSMLQKGSNKFLIDTASFKGLEDRDAPARIWYAFNLADYVQRYEGEYYINMNLDRDLSSDKIEIEKRKGVPLELNDRLKDVDHAVLEIPKGYKVTYIPENASYENEDFSFEITYRKEGNKLYFQKTLVINTLMIEEEDFENWNAMINALINAYRETITIKKI
jgi:hypothetical protein